MGFRPVTASPPGRRILVILLLLTLFLTLLAACNGPAPPEEVVQATTSSNEDIRQASVVSPLPTSAAPTVTSVLDGTPGPAEGLVSAAERSPLPPLQLRQRWQHSTNSPLAGMGFVSMDGGPVPDLAAVTTEGEIITLSKNNRSYWMSSLGSRPSAFAVGQVYGRDNGDVAISVDAQGLQVLELAGEAQQAEVVWRYDPPGRVAALAFVGEQDGALGAGLLAGTEDGQLLIFGRDNTAEPQAAVAVGDTAVHSIAALAGDSGGPVFVLLSEDGLLTAVGEDGQIRWQLTLPAPSSQLLAVDLDEDGQQEIIVATAAGELLAFDQEGNELWRWQGAGSIEALVAARLQGAEHLLVSSGSRLSALRSGEVVWQQQFTDDTLTALDSGDLDGDGQRETVLGGSGGGLWILDEAGQIRGEARLQTPIERAAVINLDGDNEQPEVIVVGDSALFLFDVEQVEAAARGPATHEPSRFAPDDTALHELPQYKMEVALDMQAHRADVRQVTSVRNGSEDVWQELVFHVATAYWPGIFTLNRAAVVQDGVTRAVDPRSELTMLHIPLPSPLEPGQEVAVEFDFLLDLPALDPVGWGPEGNAGWGPGIIQMGDWYPALVPYQTDSGWQIWEYHPVGDPVISPLADYEVLIAPSADVVLAAAGFQEQQDDSARTFALENARAFSFLASPDYVRQDGVANGVPVSVFTTPRYQAAGEVVLATAIQAIDLFSELYGPYPYDELVIAENGFLTAMEYSGLVSLSGFAFDAYDGSPSSLLVAITAHEVAHQWWYGGVGNDQTREPWLDEGLAMVSELLFYERYYPALIDWWWQFRVNRWNPIGYVDDSIYQYADSESFVHNVYGVTAYFMDELRSLMGPDSFAEFLRSYFAEHQGGFVSRDEFFTAVQEQSDINTAPLIAKYFAKS